MSTTRPRKNVRTTRGYAYSYCATPAQCGRPTLLLLHGFPDQASEWEGFISNYLTPAGYGAIAPDMLGYNESDKPTDPAAYKFRGLTADLADMLEAEGAHAAVVLGHDWGSSVAQAFYNLHPDLCAGFVMLNVAYRRPTRSPFPLDAIIMESQELLGYGTFWYWKLFAADDGAKRIGGKHLGTFFDLCHAYPDVWKSTFCAQDGLRKALDTNGEGIDLTRWPYATEDMRNVFLKRIQRDGIDAPLCSYKSLVHGHQIGELDPSNCVVKVPTLFLGYENDPICRKEKIMAPLKEGLLPCLTNVTMKGPHWGFLEYPEEFGNTVVKWLDEKYK